MCMGQDRSTVSAENGTCDSESGQSKQEQDSRWVRTERIYQQADGRSNSKEWEVGACHCHQSKPMLFMSVAQPARSGSMAFLQEALTVGSRVEHKSGCKCHDSATLTWTLVDQCGSKMERRGRQSVI